MKVFVTGGAGYVGSVVCSALIDSGFVPVVLDSLVTGRDEFVKDKIFYQGDMGDSVLLERIFREHPDIEIMIHCAEKAAVEQSVLMPYEYYQSNVVKSLELFNTVQKHGVKKIIYSSSASLYDDVPGYMVTESSPVNPRSPYARSKYATEMILRDFAAAYGTRCITLRYFNPIGADPFLRSGIQPKNPDSIIRELAKVASGEEKTFTIWGKDWGTRDGTCIRDYIHIWDLAKAYVKAAEKFDDAFEKNINKFKDYLTINIGAGIGVTVKEFIYAYENVTGEKINFVYAQRRPGDIAGSYANTSRAKHLLDWEAELPLEEAINDARRWEEAKEKKTEK
ncbi:MAG: UDP-glucose 4-epimerase GalE [Clostridiales bacterium]|nr:UDP-glucose 4-epimerase GalE [Clostridiales bacterium]